VLHTPGHTIDSISLEIVDDRALYTADTVLGQGTAVFEDLGIYLDSLDKMLKYGENDSADYQCLYPGHGPIVKNGRELISTYIKHRLEREEQVLEVLRGKPTEGDNWTIWTIVKILYASYPESLWLPAARGIELHLAKLERDCLVKRLGGEGVETKWKLVSRTPSPSL
jgi:glyoxylase-like metal-dependent hydrolase (beta-lactamase superfamily II)